MFDSTVPVVSAASVQWKEAIVIDSRRLSCRAGSTYGTGHSLPWHVTMGFSDVGRYSTLRSCTQHQSAEPWISRVVQYCTYDVVTYLRDTN